jgi:replicative DNA helicase
LSNKLIMEYTKQHKNGLKGNISDRSIDLSIYGKMPPQAKELETAVLGAIMQEKNAIDKVSEILTPECFYQDSHQRVYLAIQALRHKNQPIDILTVVEELKSRNDLDVVGGPYFVTKLTNDVVSAANIEFHARIIFEKFLQREMIRIGSEIMSAGYKEGSDVFELLDDAESKVSSIATRNLKGDVSDIASAMVKTMQRIELLRERGTSLTGISSGFEQLDRITRGFQPGDLIVLAARPSVGKTAIALNILRNAGVPALMCSLEMDQISLSLRMLSSQSELNLHRLQTGRLSDDHMDQLYKKEIQRLSELKIFFDDNFGLTLLSLKAKARRLKKKYDLGLLIVDYLQLMTGDKSDNNREREIANISRGLKSLAKELGIPIIALSQLSRDLEKRQGKKRIPQLSDLRESGAIEQDADVVMFLYAADEDEIQQDTNLITKRYLKIAKQRNGMLGVIKFDFRNEIQKFSEEPEEVAVTKWQPAEMAVDDSDEMPF